MIRLEISECSTKFPILPLVALVCWSRIVTGWPVFEQLPETFGPT